MRKTSLNWKQVVGLEPISKEDFAKALEESEKAIKNGDVISADKAYAEFIYHCADYNI
ncbi:hypothetical protein IKG73_00980 [Candidatus Saccharibacteria bacterium]|nr:hypothetical protein [Candidatus Saccharibacteria bacterium]